MRWKNHDSIKRQTAIKTAYSQVNLTPDLSGHKQLAKMWSEAKRNPLL
jgi:hypothetical protein